MKDEIVNSLNEQNEQLYAKAITKNVPLYRTGKIIQIIIPFLLIIVLTLEFLIEFLFLENPLWKAILISYLIPAIIYLGLTIPTHFLMKKFTKKISLQRATLNHKREVEITDEGINVNKLITDSVLEWEYITKVVETDDILLFILTKSNFIVVVKSNYDNEQLKSIIEIVKANVKEVKLLDEAIAEKEGDR